MHTEAVALLRHRYVLYTLDLGHERHLLALTPGDLPADWRSPLWPASTQAVGTRWFADQDSVVLEVPSAIVPHAQNYLLNPQHPLFGELVIQGPEPFELDSRLGA